MSARLRVLLLLQMLLLCACSGARVLPDWQLNSIAALNSFQRSYLRGDTSAAEFEFGRARAELASTGNPALVARAELLRCAAREIGRAHV